MRTSESVEGLGPAEEHGVSLLRSPPELEAYRSQAEKPSRIGRFVLVGLGGVVLAAGTGSWLAYRSATAEAFLGFGGFLIALGLVQHRLLQRERDHWPLNAHLWGEGLELVLANGEIRVAPWSDPKFRLDVYARPVDHSGPDEYVLVWKMDSKVPMCPITEAAFHRIRDVANANGLEITEYHASSRRRSLRAFEIRPPHQSSASPSASGDPAQSWS